ncbi:MAG: hypothetical protein M3Y49_09985 [Actinomycetota bacterium]|nr:hypothetical protein [Actinomycetota bacterium]
MTSIFTKIITGGAEQPSCSSRQMVSPTTAPVTISRSQWTGTLIYGLDSPVKAMPSPINGSSAVPGDPQ